MESTEQVEENATPVVEEVVEAAPDQTTDPVAALTADLQRLQAEYANYRKRVERDRAVAHELAIGLVLTELLATLDDIDRAESHNELTGGFKAVADQLIAITNRLGLEKYGTEGETFDPQIHEALMHDTSSEVSVATATKILQPGYKYKERILRPARVAVTEPEVATTPEAVAEPVGE
jgi:molecular chaperone GrpE